jgi:hypothetical protein
VYERRNSYVKLPRKRGVYFLCATYKVLLPCTYGVTAALSSYELRKHCVKKIESIFDEHNTTLTLLRKALRMRGVKGLPGHKKVTQCLRSGNAAYVAHTPRNVVGT